MTRSWKSWFWRTNSWYWSLSVSLCFLSAEWRQRKWSPTSTQPKTPPSPTSRSWGRNHESAKLGKPNLSAKTGQKFLGWEGWGRWVKTQLTAISQTKNNSVWKIQAGSLEIKKDWSNIPTLLSLGIHAHIQCQSMERHLPLQYPFQFAAHPSGNRRIHFKTTTSTVRIYRWDLSKPPPHHHLLQQFFKETTFTTPQPTNHQGPYSASIQRIQR